MSVGQPVVVKIPHCLTTNFQRGCATRAKSTVVDTYVERIDDSTQGKVALKDARIIPAPLNINPLHLNMS